MFTLAARADVSKQLENEYQVKLYTMSVFDLAQEFLSYLDYTEESEGGTTFHPITIGSCRVLMTRPLEMCLSELRKKVGK